jgi:SAM-dependent methyltransferase
MPPPCLGCYQQCRRFIKGKIGLESRTIPPPPLTCYQKCRRFLQGKIGLEIGGPTWNFRQTGLFPVYTIADRIDNCNFSNNTIWEGSIKEGATFRFDERRPPGNQYIAEGTNLTDIPSASYDFVLSVGTLEHIANPLQALLEWTRALKQNGLLVLMVPFRDNHWDHNRPVTSFAHLIQDFEQQVTEGDLTHLEEIYSVEPYLRENETNDPRPYEVRKEFSKENLKHRTLHHHVFDACLAAEIVHHVGLQILGMKVIKPHSIWVVAQKPMQGQEVHNERFRGTDTPPIWHSWRYRAIRRPKIE